LYYKALETQFIVSRNIFFRS